MIKKIFFKIMKKLFWHRGFSKMHLDCYNSKTYRNFCKRVYDIDLCQFSMMDLEQIKKMLEVMNLKKTDKVLDLACGMGVITEYVADKTEADVIGIDFASKAIKAANKRTKCKKNIHFVTHDMVSLNFPEKSFDVVLCIDGLYFVENLDGLVLNLKKMLKEGGKMIIFYSQLIEENKDELLPENTALAKALTRQGINFETWDFSKNEHEIWQKSKQVANELEENFKKEKNEFVWKMRVKESEKNLKRYQDNLCSRHLYRAEI